MVSDTGGDGMVEYHRPDLPEAHDVGVGNCSDCGQPVLVFFDDDGEPMAVCHLGTSQAPEFIQTVNEAVIRANARKH